ncbi:hypothetical protein NMY22_g8972 [Coprinellus aureogranulatus]|nr:hypothetical protein NMY22_g8972 [Coprinellus aureogranulatus]
MVRYTHVLKHPEILDTTEFGTRHEDRTFPQAQSSLRHRRSHPSLPHGHIPVSPPRRVLEAPNTEPHTPEPRMSNTTRGRSGVLGFVRDSRESIHLAVKPELPAVSPSSTRLTGSRDRSP